MSFEIYENNGGGVFLVILENSLPVRIFWNWEYTPGSSLISAVAELEADHTAWKSWDGDMVDDLENITIAEAYENLGILVAWRSDDGKLETFPDRMGYAARKCLGIIGEV